MNNRPRKSSFNLAEYQSNKSTKKVLTKPKNDRRVRRILASISSFVLILGYGHEFKEAREIDVKVGNQLEVVARTSNPCLSEQKLLTVVKYLKDNHLDTGNTAFFPKNPIFESEGESFSLYERTKQLKDAVGSYSSYCNKLGVVEPGLRTFSDDEKVNEEMYQGFRETNPLVNDIIQTADFSTTSNEIDKKLVDNQGKGIVPEGTHLMPYLRQFYLIRYLSMLILLVCYFGPIFRLMSDIKLFKFGLALISKILPYKI